MLDQLSFLSAVRRGAPTCLGSRVLVVGAGNSAMDCARAAKRLAGQDDEVTFVYRRSRREMPAEHEEIEVALGEGIGLAELCAPEEVLTTEGRASRLRCRCMKLVPDPDGGRPRPVPTGEERFFEADTVIVSIDQRVKADFLPEGVGLRADAHTCRTSLPTVFAGSDPVRGPSTLINAVGDGRRAAEAILDFLGLPGREATAVPPDSRRPHLEDMRLGRAVRVMGPKPSERDPAERLDFNPALRTLAEDEAVAEARRCLQCDLICNICTTVCPNRANVALLAPPLPHPVQIAFRHGAEVRVETLAAGRIPQRYQIVNIADACNECGNCATFCPSAGAPYRDKPCIHLSAASFAVAEDGYRLVSPERVEGKRAGKAFSLTAEADGFLFESESFAAHLDGVTLYATRVHWRSDADEISLSPAMEAALLHCLLVGKLPFTDLKRD